MCTWRDGLQSMKFRRIALLEFIGVIRLSLYTDSVCVITTDSLHRSCQFIKASCRKIQIMNYNDLSVYASLIFFSLFINNTTQASVVAAPYNTPVV